MLAGFLTLHAAEFKLKPLKILVIPALERGIYAASTHAHKDAWKSASACLRSYVEAG
jgi:hypothetical protein